MSFDEHLDKAIHKKIKDIYGLCKKGSEFEVMFFNYSKTMMGMEQFLRLLE